MPNIPATRDRNTSQAHTFRHYLITGDELSVAEWLARPELKSLPVLVNTEHLIAPSDVPPAEWKSIYRSAFGRYLRTGQLMTMGDALADCECKFNPNHDACGRFTFPPDGSTESDWHSGGAMAPSSVDAHAAHAMSQYQNNLAQGMSPDEAAAWAANSEAESGGDPSKVQQGGGPGRGLYQWGATTAKYDRRIDFQKFAGVPIESSTLSQQNAFRDWELANTEKAAKRKIDNAQGAAGKAYAIAVNYTRSKNKCTDAIDRANIANAIKRRTKSA